jgi:MoaA/NifB/PqqE/SkfB family radical SAM enzyme
MGPEIADVEISTVCNGIGADMERRQPCSWCYKSNTGCGTNMSLETFKQVFSKFPDILTQIAFGIGDIDGNPDLWDIMKHCRDHNVVPNLTTNGMGVTDEIAARLASLCGAVAVSHYHLDDTCFDAVARLTKAGLKQVNLHKLLSTQSYESCFRLIDKIKTDPRLADLKAVVFLLLKPVGSRNKLTAISGAGQYKELLDYAQERGVGIGFDSCSAPVVLKSLPETTHASVECCESGCFSIYVSSDAKVYPCSFCEGYGEWADGIDLRSVNDFTKEVWYSERIVAWRARLLRSSKACSCPYADACRSCPIYDITLCRSKQT